MKRILSLILTVLMLAFAISCNDVTTPAETTPADTTPPADTSTPVELEAGFGRVSITPDYDKETGKLVEPININPQKIATRVYNEIYASAIAITDGTTTLLLLSLDLRDMRTSLYSQIVEKIEQETGVPKNNIMLAVTHNHSAPELTYFHNAQLTAYKNFLVETIPEAVKLALADYAPMTMSAGRAETPGMNFVRRYIMSDGSLGSISGTNPGTTYVKHESEADTEFQTLKLERGDKKDIILSNWQCHPAAMYPAETINSDWVHFMREGVEKNNNAYFAFFNGGFGNISTASMIDGEMKYGSSWHDLSVTQRIGNALVGIVAKCLRDMEPVESGYIKIETAFAPQTKNQANLFITTIGEFALTSNPFEMFHQHGEYVKDNSPYQVTFFVGFGNGTEGYMPTAESYDRGGYERQNCRYPKDTGDLTASLLVNILKRLKSNG